MADKSLETPDYDAIIREAMIARSRAQGQLLLWLFVLPLRVARLIFYVLRPRRKDEFTDTMR